jgi:SAM-dependent methyltransferase
MDDLARYNQGRWDELAREDISFSRPWLDLDAARAMRRVDPEGISGPAEAMRGKDVLCLAGGGGQQSAAFALLGAHVTVLDLSEVQLDRDRQAAEHYGRPVRLVQGDMRDLSCFDAESFDLIYHAHSLNFVPDVAPVFDGVAGILRPGGLYRLSCTNPFIHGTWEDNWTDAGYPLSRPYVEGEEVVDDDSCWEFHGTDGRQRRVEGPHEYRHTLSTLVNGFVRCGLRILGCWEHAGDDDEANGSFFRPPDPDAKPGTWAHFKSIAPPWLTFWTIREPR